MLLFTTDHGSFASASARRVSASEKKGCGRPAQHDNDKTSTPAPAPVPDHSADPNNPQHPPTNAPSPATLPATSVACHSFRYATPAPDTIPSTRLHQGWRRDTTA